MEGETVIEKSIKKFVYSKIQELVYLDLSKASVIFIKHVSKRGSTALAMFWLRVLRHQNNYPMPKYPYKELYDKDGNNKIVLTVDEMTITTFMDSGTVMIQGVFVYEWFLHMLPVIMESYDAPVMDPQQRKTTYMEYTEKWKKLCDEDKIKKAGRDVQLRAREDRALEILNDKTTMTPDADIDSEDVTGGVKESADIVPMVNESEKIQHEEDIEAVEIDSELELMTIDVWPEAILEKQLEQLHKCSVHDGSTYIYRLWKSLLHHWFSDPTRKVYIVTPFMDPGCLGDICQIILDHRYQANLDICYVQQQCDHNKKIFEVKQVALKNFDAEAQMYLEYKIYPRIAYPGQKFHAKFIASIKDNVAEVLITSANFHGDHFEQSSMETVQYQTMSDDDFIRGFLSPMKAPLDSSM